LAFSPSGTILAADDHCDVRFYGDGEILATKSREECVRLWDIATGKSRAALDATGHFDFVFSPHGELLMVRQEVLFMYFHSLWDVRTTQPREIQLKSGEKAMANAAIGLLGAGLLGAGSLDAGFPKNPFSPDGRFFATAAKREVSIYEIATMQECASLPLSWHVDSFPVFSPDSKTLAAGGVYVPAGWLDAVRTGPEVKLWDIAASEEQVTLRWCGKPVFSPDGKTLATQGMMGNTIQLWDLPASRSVSLPIVLGAVTTLLVFAGVNRYGLCPTLTIAITAFVLWLLGMAGLWYFARLSLAKVLSLGNIHGLAAVLALLLVVGGRWCLLRLRRRTPADGWHAQSLR
jgi:WD40 repeat protein